MAAPDSTGAPSAELRGGFLQSLSTASLCGSPCPLPTSDSGEQTARRAQTSLCSIHSGTRACLFGCGIALTPSAASRSQLADGPVDSGGASIAEEAADDSTPANASSPHACSSQPELLQAAEDAGLSADDVVRVYGRVLEATMSKAGEKACAVPPAVGLPLCRFRQTLRAAPASDNEATKLLWVCSAYLLLTWCATVCCPVRYPRRGCFESVEGWKWGEESKLQAHGRRDEESRRRRRPFHGTPPATWVWRRADLRLVHQPCAGRGVQAWTPTSPKLQWPTAHPSRHFSVPSAPQRDALLARAKQARDEPGAALMHLVALDLRDSHLDQENSPNCKWTVQRLRSHVVRPRGPAQSGFPLCALSRVAL